MVCGVLCHTRDLRHRVPIPSANSWSSTPSPWCHRRVIWRFTKLPPPQGGRSGFTHGFFDSIIYIQPSPLPTGLKNSCMRTSTSPTEPPATQPTNQAPSTPPLSGNPTFIRAFSPQTGELGGRPIAPRAIWTPTRPNRVAPLDLWKGKKTVVLAFC